MRTCNIFEVLQSSWNSLWDLFAKWLKYHFITLCHVLCHFYYLSTLTFCWNWLRNHLKKAKFSWGACPETPLVHCKCVLCTLLMASPLFICFLRPCVVGPIQIQNDKYDIPLAASERLQQWGCWYAYSTRNTSTRMWEEVQNPADLHKCINVTTNADKTWLFRHPHSLDPLIPGCQELWLTKILQTHTMGRLYTIFIGDLGNPVTMRVCSRVDRRTHIHTTHAQKGNVTI